MIKAIPTTKDIIEEYDDVLCRTITIDEESIYD